MISIDGLDTIGGSTPQLVFVTLLVQYVLGNLYLRIPCNEMDGWMDGRSVGGLVGWWVGGLVGCPVCMSLFVEVVVAAALVFFWECFFFGEFVLVGTMM